MAAVMAMVTMPTNGPSTLLEAPDPMRKSPAS